MKCEISLETIEFYAYHGCYDLEQKVGNRFEVDITITAELDVEMEDEVSQSVNYLTVYQIVREQMQITQKTIEVVCLNIIKAVKASDSRILTIDCCVKKLAPPLGGKVRAASVRFTF